MSLFLPWECTVGVFQDIYVSKAGVFVCLLGLYLHRCLEYICRLLVGVVEGKLGLSIVLRLQSLFYIHCELLSLCHYTKQIKSERWSTTTEI